MASRATARPTPGSPRNPRARARASLESRLVESLFFSQPVDTVCAADARPRRPPATARGGFGRAGVCKTTDRDSSAVYVLRAHFDYVSRTRRARRLRAVGRPPRATRRAAKDTTRARQSPARATARARANARTARARPTGEGIDARATISATDRRRDRSIEDISAVSAGGNGARDAREGEDARETGCRR